MPSSNELLLELHKTRMKMWEHAESLERYKLRESILLEEIEARGIDVEQQLPRALEWFMESF